MKLNNYILPNWNDGKIKRTKKISDFKILLLSLNGLSSKEGSKNLLAVDNNDNILWIAELPTEMYDSYYEMKYEQGVIKAKSSNSFLVVVNPETGSIINKYMIK